MSIIMMNLWSYLVSNSNQNRKILVLRFDHFQFKTIIKWIEFLIKLVVEWWLMKQRNVFRV